MFLHNAVYYSTINALIIGAYAAACRASENPSSICSDKTKELIFYASIYDPFLHRSACSRYHRDGAAFCVQEREADRKNNDTGSDACVICCADIPNEQGAS